MFYTNIRSPVKSELTASLCRESLEQRQGMRRPGEGGYLVPQALGARPIGGIGEHRRYSLTHHFGRGLDRVEHPGYTELLAARRVQRLVGAHGEHHHRQAVRERTEDAARAAVRDDSA